MYVWAACSSLSVSSSCSLSSSHIPKPWPLLSFPSRLMSLFIVSPQSVLQSSYISFFYFFPKKLENKIESEVYKNIKACWKSKILRYSVLTSGGTQFSLKVKSHLFNIPATFFISVKSYIHLFSVSLSPPERLSVLRWWFSPSIMTLQKRALSTT